MRVLTIAIALAAFTTAASADSLRSDRHFVKIDVQALSNTSRQYDVKVFDAESRSGIMNFNVTTNGNVPKEAETTIDGTHYKVRIEPLGTSYMIAFTADHDTMRGGFTHGTATTPARAQSARAGRDINEPALLRRIEPVYTEDAKTAGAAGTVVLELLIDKSGFVRDAKVLKPMGYGLDEAAVDAVKQWQFAPSMLQRVPVEVLQEVTIEFQP